MGENLLRLQTDLSQLPAAERAAIVHYLLGMLDGEEDVEDDRAPENDRRYAEIAAKTAKQGQPPQAARTEWREDFP